MTTATEPATMADMAAIILHDLRSGEGVPDSHIAVYAASWMALAGESQAAADELAARVAAHDAAVMAGPKPKLGSLREAFAREARTDD